MILDTLYVTFPHQGMEVVLPFHAPEQTEINYERQDGVFFLYTVAQDGAQIPVQQTTNRHDGRPLLHSPFLGLDRGSGQQKGVTILCLGVCHDHTVLVQAT